VGHSGIEPLSVGCRPTVLTIKLMALALLFNFTWKHQENQVTDS